MGWVMALLPCGPPPRPGPVLRDTARHRGDSVLRRGADDRAPPTSSRASTSTRCSPSFSSSLAISSASRCVEASGALGAVDDRRHRACSAPVVFSAISGSEAGYGERFSTGLLVAAARSTTWSPPHDRDDPLRHRLRYVDREALRRRIRCRLRARRLRRLHLLPRRRARAERARAFRAPGVRRGYPRRRLAILAPVAILGRACTPASSRRPRRPVTACVYAIVVVSFI